MTRRSVVALAAAAVLLAGCSSPKPSLVLNPSPAGDQVFRIGGGEPPTLDPQRATDAESFVLLHQLSRPLLWLDRDLHLTTEGGLASGYRFSNGGKTLTFTLKDNLQYSNGDPIKASDFVYAIQRLADPRTAAGYSYLLGSGLMNLVGADAVLGLDPESLPSDAQLEEMLDGLGVSAPNDRTVVFELATATSYAPFIATYWVFVPTPRSWITSRDATEADHYLSSGPFVLSEWKHDVKIILEPNPYWVGPAARLSKVEITLYPYREQAYRAYLSDEVDAAQLWSAADIADARDRDLMHGASRGSMLAIEYVGFDMRGAVGTPRATSVVDTSKALRHALTEAIDKQALVDAANQGQATPVTSMVPRGMFGYQADIGLTYDAARARVDLRTALDELGVTVADLSAGGSDALELTLTSGGQAAERDIAEFLQSQWKQNLGITVRLTDLPGQAFDARLEQPYSMFLGHWISLYPHPNASLNGVFGCSADGQPSSTNLTRWCNTGYNDLLRQAAGTLDTGAQVPLYDQAQEILVDEAPAIFLAQWGQFTLIKPWVRGVVTTGLDVWPGEYFMDRVWITTH